MRKKEYLSILLIVSSLKFKNMIKTFIRTEHVFSNLFGLLADCSTLFGRVHKKYVQLCLNLALRGHIYIIFIKHCGNKSIKLSLFLYISTRQVLAWSYSRQDDKVWLKIFFVTVYLFSSSFLFWQIHLLVLNCSSYKLSAKSVSKWKVFLLPGYFMFPPGHSVVNKF